VLTKLSKITYPAVIKKKAIITGQQYFMGPTSLFFFLFFWDAKFCTHPKIKNEKEKEKEGIFCRNFLFI
jgi:hypothetical protein